MPRGRHSSEAPPRYSTDRVAERNLGAFAAWAAPNEWYAGHNQGTMHCCTANGARTLYWVWDRIAKHQNGRLRVNLLLNRASKWADIDSYLPYQGRVEIEIKESFELDVRIPEWVSPQDVRATVGRDERSVDWEGRYALLGSVSPGQGRLDVPNQRADRVAQIEKQKYTIVRRGNEVVWMTPTGRYYPLFQHAPYRSDEPRLREVERFVSDERVEW